jgi:hypothetical protein
MGTTASLDPGRLGTIIAFGFGPPFLLCRGASMTKFSSLGAPSNRPLRDSISIISKTHVQFHVVTDMTTTELASRIELCNALLFELSGVRSSLARDIQRTRAHPPALN